MNIKNPIRIGSIFEKKIEKFIFYPQKENAHLLKLEI